jgi:hypothetical protein
MNTLPLARSGSAASGIEPQAAPGGPAFGPEMYP